MNGWKKIRLKCNNLHGYHSWINKWGFTRRQLILHLIAKVFLRPKGLAVVWTLFLKCLRHSKSCLQLWGEKTSSCDQKFQIRRERSGFFIDLGFSLKASRKVCWSWELGSVDENLCSITISTYLIVSVYSESIHEFYYLRGVAHITC